MPPAEAARLDVGLKSSVLQLQAFEVKEAARGQALAINQQKTAAGIVNIVSEETFGSMLERQSRLCAAAAARHQRRRRPGRLADRDQPPRRSRRFQLLPSRRPAPAQCGGTNRASNMRNLVADGVTNIEVMKAVTPDRDGDAIGGIINIVSRTAFQRDGREYRLVGSMSYNDLNGDWGHNAARDVLRYLQHSRQGEEPRHHASPRRNYKTDRYSENADIDWVVVTRGEQPDAEPDPGHEVPRGEPYRARVEGTTKTWGFNASIDFRIDAHNSFFFRPYFSHYDQHSQTFETDWDIDTRFQDEVGGRKTYAFLSSDGSRGRGTPGANGSRSTLGYIGTDDDTTTTSGPGPSAASTSATRSR